MEHCVRKDSGECQGPVVADLILQVKLGKRNAGPPLEFPLCLAHAIQGGVYSWLAGVGEKVAWGAIESIAPKTRKGLHIKHRVVAREPWKSLLRELGR